MPLYKQEFVPDGMKFGVDILAWLCQLWTGLQLVPVQILCAKRFAIFQYFCAKRFGVFSISDVPINTVVGPYTQVHCRTMSYAA